MNSGHGMTCLWLRFGKRSRPPMCRHKTQSIQMTVSGVGQIWASVQRGPYLGLVWGENREELTETFVAQALGMEPIVGWCVWGVYLHLTSTLVTWGPVSKPTSRPKWEVKARKDRRAWGTVLSIPGPASLRAWRFNTGCNCIPVRGSWAHSWNICSTRSRPAS